MSDWKLWQILIFYYLLAGLGAELAETRVSKKYSTEQQVYNFSLLISCTSLTDRPLPELVSYH